MRRPNLVVLVALALVLAGCNGFALDGDGSTAETVTPMSVPTDEPTPTPVPQLAPGLTGEGVTDPFALGDAHAAALDGQSFTFHRETVVQSSNGTTDRLTESDARVAANRSRYDATVTVSGADVPVVNGSRYRIEQWSNDTRTLVAQRMDGNTSYTIEHDTDGRPVPTEFGEQGILGSDPASAQTIYSLFSATRTRVVGETNRNGTTYYDVAATNVTDPTPFAAFAVEGTDDLRNVSFRARITSDGLVRSYRIDYAATLGGEGVPGATGRTIHVHHVVRYSDVGTTTVERPSWYEATMANASTATTVG